MAQPVRTLVLIAALAFLLGACGDLDLGDPAPQGHVCTDEMDETRAAHGPPEEVNTYSSRGYNSESWWYWSQGYQRRFAWGSSVRYGCSTSTYTFSPIDR